MAAAALVAPQFAQAATIDWNATAATTAWLTADNWTGVPTPPTDSLTADIARFNQISYLSQPDAGITSIAGIQVGDGTTATGALTISTILLSIGSGGVLINPNAGAVTVNGAVQLGASQAWENDSSSTLTVGASINNFADTTPFTLTLQGSGDGGIALNGAIANGGPTGTTALTINRTGTGTVTLSAANTFSGGVTVNSGIVAASLAGVANTSGPLGTGATTVNTGGELRATVANALLGPSAINLSGGTVRLYNAATTNFGGNLTYSSGSLILDRTASGTANTDTMGTLSIGAVTLTPTTVNYTSAPTLVFGATTLTGNPTFDTTNANITLGALNDGGSVARTITVQGVKNLTLNAAASSLITGTQFTVNSGVLVANAAGSLSIVPTTTNNTTVTVNGGELKGTFAGSFKSSGTGTPSQAISLAGGTVRLANSASTDFGGNLTYTNGSLILDRITSGAATTATMGALSIGAVTLTPTTANYTGAPTLVFGATTLTGNATLDATNAIIAVGALNDGGSAKTLTLQAGRTFTLNSASPNFGSASAIILKAGTLYPKSTTAAGTSTITLGDASGGTANTTLDVSALNGSTISNPISVAGTNTGVAKISYNYTGTFGTETVSSPITLNTHDLTITCIENGNNLTVSGAISGTGNLVLTAGTNNYNNGTLKLSNTAGGINNAGSITVNGSSSGYTTFNLSGNIGSNVTDVIVNPTAGNTVTLSGTNTFSGNLKIQQGTVWLNSAQSANAAGAKTIYLGAASTAYNASLNIGSATISNPLSLVAGDTGTLTLRLGSANAGAAVFSGAISLNGDNLTITNSDNGSNSNQMASRFTGGITGTGDVTIKNGTTIGQPLTISGGDINNTGKLIEATTTAGNGLIFSSNIGPNVTQVVQNSTVESLILSTKNESAATQVLAGTLQLQKAISLNNNDSAKWTAANIDVKSGAQLLLRVGTSAAGYFDDTAIGTIITNTVAGGTTSTGFEPGAILGLDISAAGTFTIASNIVDTGGGKNGSSAGLGLNLNGANILTLSGANAYSGVTGIYNGANVKVSSINSVNGGTPLLATSSLGAPITVANGTIQLGNGTANGALTYIGSGETTDRVINLASTTGGAYLDQSGTGLLKFTSNLTATGAGSKTLVLQGSSTGTGEFAGVIVDNSGTNKTSLTKAGTGAWTLSAANTYTGQTSIQRGILGVNSLANAFTPTLTTTLGSAIVTASDTTGLVVGQTVVSGKIPSGSTIFSIDSPTQFTLNSGTSVTAGTAQASTITTPNSLGLAASAIAMGSTTTTGQLTYTGTGSTTNRVVNLAGTTGGAIIDQSGAGLLKFTSNLTAPGTAGVDNRKTLTLQGSTAGTGEIAGAIVNSTLGTAGQLDTSLTKAGSGTWTLSGANTYTGATNVTGGTLSIASTGAINNTSGVTINGISSADANFNYNSATPMTQPISFNFIGGTLSGTGTISVAVNPGGIGTIKPGNSPGSQTYTAGLTFSAGDTYAWQHNAGDNMGAAGVSFSELVLNGAGNIAVNSGAKLSLTFANTTDFTTGFWDANRSWDIIRNAGGGGSISGNFADADILLNGSLAGYVNAGSIVSGQGAFTTALSGGNEVLTWTPSGGGGPLLAGSGTWVGAADNKWTTNTGPNNNWSTAIPSGAGDVATFGDTGKGTVDLNTSQTIGKLVLNTTTGGYIIGAGAAGSQTLTMSKGSLTVAAIDALQGTHTINAKVVATADLDVGVTAGSLNLAGGIDNAAGTTTKFSGTVSAGAITGAGNTSVLPSASLTADSIVQGTLSIGAGGVVTIRETTGGSVSSVPEPGTWVLIGTALIGWLTFRRRQR